MKIRINKEVLVMLQIKHFGRAIKRVKLSDYQEKYELQGGFK